MTKIRESMEALLNGTSTEPRTEQEESEAPALKPLMQQIVMVMQTMGVPLDDDDAVDEFLKTLKVVATSKAAVLRSAIRSWNNAKAAKSVKAAKAAL